MWSVVTKCAYLIPYLHICSDWLITKKIKYPEFCMGYMMKLGMWVEMGRSTTHVVCRHQMCIFNTLFAYLFWLANNNKKKKNIQSSVWATLMKLGMWVVMGTSTTHVVCYHQMCIFNTSFVYLFWLANNKKNQICNNWYAYVKSDLRSLPTYAPKGGPRCIFCEYSERVSRELQNSSSIIFSSANAHHQCCEVNLCSKQSTILDRNS